jgi:hypothetical protein
MNRAQTEQVVITRSRRCPVTRSGEGRGGESRRARQKLRSSASRGVVKGVKATPGEPKT